MSKRARETGVEGERRIQLIGLGTSCPASSDHGKVVHEETLWSLFVVLSRAWSRIYLEHFSFRRCYIRRTYLQVYRNKVVSRSAPIFRFQQVTQTSISSSSVCGFAGDRRRDGSRHPYTPLIHKTILHFTPSYIPTIQAEDADAPYSCTLLPFTPPRSFDRFCNRLFRLRSGRDTFIYELYIRESLCKYLYLITALT